MSGRRRFFSGKQVIARRRVFPLISLRGYLFGKAAGARLEVTDLGDGRFPYVIHEGFACTLASTRFLET